MNEEDVMNFEAGYKRAIAHLRAGEFESPLGQILGKVVLEILADEREKFAAKLVEQYWSYKKENSCYDANTLLSHLLGIIKKEAARE